MTWDDFLRVTPFWWKIIWNANKNSNEFDIYKWGLFINYVTKFLWFFNMNRDVFFWKSWPKSLYQIPPKLLSFCKIKKNLLRNLWMPPILRHSEIFYDWLNFFSKFEWKYLKSIKNSNKIQIMTNFCYLGKCGKFVKMYVYSFFGNWWKSRKIKREKRLN